MKTIDYLFPSLLLFSVFSWACAPQDEALNGNEVREISRETNFRSDCPLVKGENEDFLTYFGTESGLLMQVTSSTISQAPNIFDGKLFQNEMGRPVKIELYKNQTTLFTSRLYYDPRGALDFISETNETNQELMSETHYVWNGERLDSATTIKLLEGVKLRWRYKYIDDLVSSMHLEVARSLKGSFEPQESVYIARGNGAVTLTDKSPSGKITAYQVFYCQVCKINLLHHLMATPLVSDAVKSERYATAGADKIWFTADDRLRFANKYSYKCE